MVSFGTYQETHNFTTDIKMILSRQEIKHLYHRTARFYDLALWGYRLIGITRHRHKAVAWLRLKPGDTVVDLGCGTGANFHLLVQAVGPAGRIFGVDLSGAMLARAKKRIIQAGWQNIELVEAGNMSAFTPGSLSNTT